MLSSCIYEGTIRHRRFLPVENAFRYRLFLVYLDLSELERVFALHPLWSCERPNIAWLRRGTTSGTRVCPWNRRCATSCRPAPGGGRPGPSACSATCAISATASTRRASSTVGIPTDTRVETIIVEIHNTPWGEVHTYVLDRAWNEHPVAGLAPPPDGQGVPRLALHRHGHPLRLALPHPGDELKVHMIDYQKGARLFDASLALRRTQITRAA
jgi:uncharacterized protein